MNSVEYALKICQLLQTKHNKNFAFVFDKPGNLLTSGSHSGLAGGTYQTALINAIQNHYTLPRDACWAVCSYAPTDMCLGMAHLLGLHSVWYLDSRGAQVAEMKGKISYTRFGSEFSPWLAKCDLAAVKWAAQADPALAQAADDKLFNEDARFLLGEMKNGVTGAFSSRPKEDSALDAALRCVPTSDPPGAGSFPEAEEIYTHLTFAMVGQTWNPTMNEVSRDGLLKGEIFMGNNIAGVLLDENYSIVAWGLNFSAQNPTFHAETLMLQRFLREKGLNKLPANYTIYTSLQPCDMCGSFIKHVGNSTKVIYGLGDVDLVTSLTTNKSAATATEKRSTVGSVKSLQDIVKAKHDKVGGNSAGLLRDTEDTDYRFKTLALFRSYLTPREQEDFDYLNDLKARRKYLSDDDYRWLMRTWDRLDKIPNIKKDMRWNSPLHASGALANRAQGDGKSAIPAKSRLGFEFVRSVDMIMDWASATPGPTVSAKIPKAAKQGLEVLEALVRSGFSTAYGLKMIDFVIQKQESLEKLAAATTPTVTTAEKVT